MIITGTKESLEALAASLTLKAKCPESIFILIGHEVKGRLIEVEIR